MRPTPKAGQKYRHFKGNEVVILGTAIHTETNERLVIYQHDKDVWARPVDMFLSEVDHEKYPNVSQKYRFEEIVQAFV